MLLYKIQLASSFVLKVIEDEMINKTLSNSPEEMFLEIEDQEH